MEISELTQGARVLLEDGNVGEVVSIAADGKSAGIKIVEAPFEPAKEGTVIDCTSYDLVAFAEGMNYDSTRPPL